MPGTMTTTTTTVVFCCTQIRQLRFLRTTIILYCTNDKLRTHSTHSARYSKPARKRRTKPRVKYGVLPRNEQCLYSYDKEDGQTGSKAAAHCWIYSQYIHIVRVPTRCSQSPGPQHYNTRAAGTATYNSTSSTSHYCTVIR